MTSDSLDNRTQAIGKYRHYKGNEYEVLGTVYHSETEELLVLYRPLYDEENTEKDTNKRSNLWVRPYDMFNESIESENKKIKRFTFIDN